MYMSVYQSQGKCSEIFQKNMKIIKNFNTADIIWTTVGR